MLDFDEESKRTESEEVAANGKAPDTVNIDFTGVRDGKEFEGGSAKSFDLVLGSKRFVPGFEEQVIKDVIICLAGDGAMDSDGLHDWACDIVDEIHKEFGA